MPTDATTEAEAREKADKLLISMTSFPSWPTPAEQVGLIAAELLAAEQEGHRRGVADATDLLGRCGMPELAAELRRRLGGEAT